MKTRSGNKDKQPVDKKRVIIAGDLIIDHNLAYLPIVNPEYYGISKHIVNSQIPGGVWYLRDVIASTCSDLDAEAIVPQIQKEDFSLQKDNASHAYQVWMPFPQQTGSKKKVWRIKEFLGCEPFSHGKPDESEKPLKYWPEKLNESDILLFDDIGPGYFERNAGIIQKLEQADKVQDIVLKISSLPENTFSSRFLHTLFRDYADRLTVVLSVDVLRRREAAISRGLSWDLAIEELRREYEEKRSSLDLARCKRSIVYFDTEGAACFVKSKDKAYAQLKNFLYDPKRYEGAFRARRPGIMYGTSTLITASLIRHILVPVKYPLYIAVGRALAAARIQYHLGGGTSNNLDRKATNEAVIHALQNTIRQEDQEVWDALQTKEREPAALFSTAFQHDLLSKEEQCADGRSDLLQDMTRPGSEYMAAKAFEIVALGIGKALKNVPMACYGKYKTADREEIDRINAVRNLMIQYRENNGDYRPLSIAVFGAPGSGKSFAIKQVAEELFGQTKSILEFNLSQFGNREELHTAFHQVRDASVQGRIPLVFWDEYDSHDLCWLKEFLAPMQDARFTAGNITHPFGKSIFIFAGGTFETFEEFSLSAGTKKELKGPDFVSRLRGFVNVKGPNPTIRPSGKNKEKRLPHAQLVKLDPAHVIRRAIMLRVIIEKDYPHLIDAATEMVSLSASVISGFLHVEKYLHGARSLEAIVAMSNLADTRHFGVTQLPAQDLLHLHVSRDFLERVQQEQLEITIFEAIAAACHEGWCKQKRKEGYDYAETRNDDERKGTKTHPLLKDYVRLSEQEKEYNRVTARRTSAKLHETGYEIVRLNKAEKNKVVEKFPEKDRSQIIRIEHDIWLREKMINGYDFAEITNDNLRLHRCVQQFERLNSADKALDEAIVDSLIPVLKENGYVLIKTKGRHKNDLMNPGTGNS